MTTPFLARLAIVGGLILVYGAALQCSLSAHFYGAFRIDGPFFCVFGQEEARVLGGPLTTPAHIVPEWFTLPLYAVLRSVTVGLGPLDAKTLGLVAFNGALLAPLVVALFPWRTLPDAAWISLTPIPAVFIALGVIGALPAEGAPFRIGQALTLFYFATLLVIFPGLALSLKRAAPG